MKVVLITQLVQLLISYLTWMVGCLINQFSFPELNSELSRFSRSQMSIMSASHRHQNTEG